MKHYIFLLTASLTLLPSPGFADSQEIWNKLKTGGLVVLMRHMSVIKENNPLLRDASCAKERKLSAKGKKQAANIGKAFRDKNIPIEKVLTSPYCRTTDTADITFGKSQPANFLSVLHALTAKQADQYTEQLTTTIGSYKGKGNLVFVTHEPNIAAIAFEQVEMGAFLVLQPTGEQEFDELGKIKLQN